MIFEEGAIRFDFLERSWSNVLKYDEEKDFEKIRINNNKGVDFIGVCSEKDAVYFIEVKDYRGHRILSKPKIEELDDTIALKVRDTLAGIIGGARNSTHLKAEWKEFLEYVSNDGRQCYIILWMEEDNINNKRTKSARANLNQRLKKKLSWLTKRVIVTSLNENPIEDVLDVSFI